MSAISFTSPRLRRAELGTALQHWLLGVLPIVWTLLLFGIQLSGNTTALDFHFVYFPAAFRLLHGGDPYAYTQSDLMHGATFVYPALSALTLAPFATLGLAVSRIIFVVVCVACVPATLRALGIQDWRVYGIAMLWLPVYIAWQTANLSLPLTLMIALVWRYRDRPIVAGSLTAAAISMKPFVWPLALWLLATRRYKAAAATIAWAMPLNLVAWGIVGFSRFHAYMHLDSVVVDAMWRNGYGVLAVAGHLGLGRGVGELLLLAVSAVLGLTAVRVGRHGREKDALTLAVALMLVASPLVWNHYFVLLLVPVALAKPRLSWVWGAPLLMWVCFRQTAALWQIALLWAVALAMCASLLRSWSANGAAVVAG